MLQRLMTLISRGSTRGNPGRFRASNRPRGEGRGLVGVARALLRRR